MKARKSTAKPYQGTATHNKHVPSNNLANHGKLWDAKPGASGLEIAPRSTGCTANCGKPQDAKPEAVGLPHGQLYARSVTGLFASE